MHDKKNDHESWFLEALLLRQAEGELKNQLTLQMVLYLTLCLSLGTSITHTTIMWGHGKS